MTKRLDAVISRASDLTISDELRADLAKYLCVLASGHLEECIRILLVSYVKTGSNPRVANFADSHIRRITNLKEGKIHELLAIFDPAWDQVFTSALSDEHKAAIDSVVTNRHLIAHGKNTGLSLATIKSYWKCIKQVVQILEDKVIL